MLVPSTKASARCESALGPTPYPLPRPLPPSPPLHHAQPLRVYRLCTSLTPPSLPAGPGGGGRGGLKSRQGRAAINGGKFKRAACLHSKIGWQPD